MIGESLHGANLVDIVYGGDVPGVGDPTDDYVQASKLYRDTIGWDMRQVQVVQADRALHTIMQRAGRRHSSVAGVPLPEPAPAGRPLGEVIVERRSATSFAGRAVPLDVLSGLVRLSYGRNALAEEPPSFFRPTPSAGALYPLEVFLFVRQVDGLPAGLYHADVFRTMVVPLAPHGPAQRDALVAACLDERLADEAPLVMVISAALWRTRVKYAQRALRFVLMEVGHLAQNIVLLATAYGLTGRVLGGFCDDEMARLLGLDGVDEVPLAVLPLGFAGTSGD